MPSKMTINLLLLIGLLCFTSKAEHLLFSPPKKGFMPIMKDFMSGFFSHFQLPFPSEVLNCYTERGTMAFFDLLEVSYQLGQDLLDGNNQSYRILVDSFSMLDDEVTPFFMCQWQTDDWKNLLHHTIPGYKIPENDAIYLNYISKFYKLHIEGQLVELAMLLEDTQRSLLIGNYIKAGDEYAKVFEKSTAFLNESMIEYLKFEAFDIGFTIALGFSYEDSSIFCYTNENVETPIEWYYHLAQAITQADMSNVTNATTEFFEVTGPELKGHIPKEIGLCLEKMPGTKRFSQKFHLETEDPIFPYALIYFAKRKPELYYNQMTSIWTNFDDWDFLNAGLEFGDMIMQILELYANRVR